jgi:phosphohistidine phosphatase
VALKTLLVMRHAKSDWGAAFSDDHERPLADRGVKAARRIGRFLTNAGMEPELVVSSTAVRARTTSELAAKAGGWKCPIETTPELYASDVATVLEVLALTDPAVDRVLVSGHEPTWSMLVSQLMGGGRVRMPTAAVACLDHTVGWQRLDTGTCELRWLITPKMLKGK